jgi:hypothetical protein
VSEEECLRISPRQNEFLRMIGKPPMEDEGGPGKVQPGHHAPMAMKR